MTSARSGRGSIVVRRRAPAPCVLPQSPESSFESVAMNVRRPFVPDIQAAGRSRRRRLPVSGAHAIARFGAGGEHAVGDEVDVGAVFADPGRDVQHVGAFAGVLVDREVAQIARELAVLLRRLRTRTGPAGLRVAARVAGASSDSSVSRAVSVKNTLVPSLFAPWKPTSLSSSPGSSSAEPRRRAAASAPSRCRACTGA